MRRGAASILGIEVAEFCRQITRGVKNPPNVYSVRKLGIEHEVRKGSQAPRTQTREAKFVGVARGADSGMLADGSQSLVKSRDEVETDFVACLSLIIVDSVVHVPIRSGSAENSL